MSFFLMAVLALISFYVISGVAVFLWGTWKYMPGKGGRLVTRQAGRRIAFKGFPFTMKLFVRGEETIKSDSIDQVRVVLVVDKSASMGDNAPGTRLCKAKEACVKFIKSINTSTCHAGIVAYDDDAELCCQITPNRSAMLEGVEKIHSGGGTDIGLGLERAERLLETCNPPEVDKRLIILLTDGEPYNGRDFGETECVALAHDIKEKGMKIICVGIGEANETFLRKMASPKAGEDADDLESREYFTPATRDELIDFYTSTAQALEAPAGVRVEVSESLNSKCFYLENCSQVFTPESLDLKSWKMKWFLPHIHTSDTEIAYQLVPARYGWHKINPDPVKMTWHNAEVIPQKEKLSNNNPYILVLPAIAWWLWFILANPVFWLIWGKIWKSKKVGIVPTDYKVESFNLKVDIDPIVKPEVQKRIKFRKTLVVGFGDSGQWILVYFKKILMDLNLGVFPGEDIRLLCIDSDNSRTISRISFAGVELSDHEFAYAPSDVYDFHECLMQSEHEHMKWYESEELRNLTKESFNISHGSGRLRQLGRLSFFAAMQDEKLKAGLRIRCCG